jgi:hypothetical protein
MLLSSLYACVRLLVDLLLVRAQPSAARDVEVLALRTRSGSFVATPSAPATCPATASSSPG